MTVQPGNGQSPTGAGKAPPPMYHSVEGWVTCHFLPMFRRPLGGEYRCQNRGQQRGDRVIMTQHPAHRMTQVVTDAAAELRGYLDPAVTVPWELTDDDHRAIVARLHDSISELATCIEGIAQATGDERAHRQLTDAVARMRHGCVHISAATATLGRPDNQPRPRAHMVTRPAQLSARDFPAAMTSDVLRAGADEPLQPPGPRLTALPGGRHADNPRRHNPRTM